MGHYDLGLLVKSECGSSVKCDSGPYELNLRRRDATTHQKRASRVCAVYLKATLSGVAIGQTQIVKNCSNSQKLRIWRVFSPSESTTAKSHERMTWLKRNGSNKLRDRSTASRTRAVSGTLMPAKTIAMAYLSSL